MGSLLFSLMQQECVIFIETYRCFLMAAAVKLWDYGWMLLTAGNNRPAGGGSIQSINRDGMQTPVSHRNILSCPYLIIAKMLPCRKC